MHGWRPLDMPGRWPVAPLTDPDRLAELIDFVATPRFRRRGTLFVVFCDKDGYVIHPVALTSLDDGPDADDERLLDACAEMLAEHFPSDSLAVGIARAQPPDWTDEDRAWARLAEQACRHHGIRFVGAAVVTDDGRAAVGIPRM